MISEIVLEKNRGVFVESGKKNKTMFFLTVVILILFVILCVVFKEREVTVLFYKGDMLYKIQQCERGWLQYSTISLNVSKIWLINRWYL